jgi:plastocyanin
MPRLTALLAATTVTALLAACSDSVSLERLAPTAPTAARAEEKVKRIEMRDACDPMTFDAVLGEGSCARSGGVKFGQFIEQLTRKGVAPAWFFAPPTVEARVGQTLLAINRGGEVHTFTEVEEFGGGIVPLLNQLSHNTAVAPECQALAPSDFVPAGGTTSDDVEEAGVEHYQCCIHPWMRTTVIARQK